MSTGVPEQAADRGEPRATCSARSTNTTGSGRTFFAAHGFGPTTTYDLVWGDRRYPPKAILGTAYEFATGQRLASGDFEGGKSGAVKVLAGLGFDVRPRHPTA